MHKEETSGSIVAILKEIHTYLSFERDHGSLVEFCTNKITMLNSPAAQLETSNSR